MGLTVSHGRYLSPKTNIPLAGFRVATVDSTISIFAGLLVFPLVFNGLYSQLGASGLELVFETIPSFLFQIEHGKIFGLGLFLCLYVSAIGACVGLLETITSNIMEVKKMERKKVSWSAGFVGLLLSMFLAVIFIKRNDYSINGKSLFEIFDITLVNILLPLTCFIVLFMVYYFIDNQTRRSEFFVE